MMLLLSVEVMRHSVLHYLPKKMGQNPYFCLKVRQEFGVVVTAATHETYAVCTMHQPTYWLKATAKMNSSKMYFVLLKDKLTKKWHVSSFVPQPPVQLG